jgi:hypothetical protein
MEQRTTPMPVIAGVLILISVGFRALGLLAALVFGLFILIWPAGGVLIALGAVGVVVCVGLLVLAAVGGVDALQRRRWGFALTGAIIAALPFSLLGVAAIVLLALSREEFSSSPR